MELPKLVIYGDYIGFFAALKRPQLTQMEDRMQTDFFAIFGNVDFVSYP